MSDACPTCGRSVLSELRFCKFCTGDAGFPNVRWANLKPEVTALSRRAAKARRAAIKSGTLAEHDRLVAMAQTSQLVINRKLRQLASWINRDNKLYLNFYKLKKLDPSYTEDIWNMQRNSAENAVNPLFYDDLSIAAITVDGVGMSYYGEYSIFVSENAIANRTTVFEENPFTFNKRHRVIAGKMAPAGFRAPWQNRAALASAKLGAKLTPGATDADLAELVMARTRGASDCDFIEAHVYGEIHAECIVSVVGPRPKVRSEFIIWRDLKRQLAELGASVIESA